MAAVVTRVRSAVVLVSCVAVALMDGVPTVAVMLATDVLTTLIVVAVLARPAMARVVVSAATI